jgi:hypothetical protein
MTNLYQVTFFKKWSQEVEIILNILADSKEDAINLLIDLDNNNDDDEFLGLENLEYSIRVA